MQVQKRKLILATGLAFIAFSCTIDPSKKCNVFQYKGSSFESEFFTELALPEGCTHVTLNKQSAELVLPELMRFMLMRAKSDEHFKKIAAEFDSYYVQLANVSSKDGIVTMINGYKIGGFHSGPAKDWVVVDGGGIDYFGGSIAEQSREIIINFNQPW
jgi:hypothetical protein